MNGRDTEQYNESRKTLLKKLKDKYDLYGLTDSHLTDFYPKLDDHSLDSCLSLCELLIVKYNLPPEEAIAEMNGLLDCQLSALAMLYKSGFRGAHLRAWKAKEEVKLTLEHVQILEWLRESVKIKPDEAILAIDGVRKFPGLAYYFMLVNAVDNLLHSWVNNQITLSSDALMIVLNKFENDTHQIRKAVTELFIRILNQKIELNADDMIAAIGMLEGEAFRALRLRAPLSSDQALQLANALALTAIKRGDFTVAARLHEQHKLNMVSLNQALLDQNGKCELKIHDLSVLSNCQTFMRALIEGLSELEACQAGDVVNCKISELKTYYDEFMILSENITRKIADHGFTHKEATLFSCSQELRDLVTKGIFNDEFMKDLARTALQTRQPNEAEAIIFLKDVNESISKIELYTMINKYMFQFAKKAIDNELAEYLDRNYLALDQRYNRAESLLQTVDTRTDRLELKGLIKYQFGLLKGTLPPEEMKGTLKHELPFSKPVPEEDDYRQTIYRLNGSEYLNN